jgi:hypothetical protein
MYKLLNVGRNYKTAKSDSISEYLTAIMYMSPLNTKICPYQNIAKCKEACLNTAGRGGMNVVQKGRLRKTNWFLNDEPSFMEQLFQDITKFVRHCTKHGRKPAVRLNGTSDIQWEYKKYLGQTLFEHFPEVQFYDYTKIPTRNISNIPNYQLTWSYSEANLKYADFFREALDKGMNVAVVFNHDLPKQFKGVPVIDGDLHDLRFLDQTNSVVGLRAKGSAKKDDSGFVINVINL